MSGNILNLHAFASTSELKTLVYDPNEETTIIKDKYQLDHESDVIYLFENFQINKGALLTIAKYNSEINQNNGILRIKCAHLTLEDDTKITINGEGISVVKIRGQGESYQGIPKESRLNNCGGGDDAVGVVGAGGGYGTNDMNGINSKNGGINRGGIASLEMLIVALQGTSNQFSFPAKRQINWRTQSRAGNKETLKHERIKIIVKALTKRRTINIIIIRKTLE